MWLDSCLDHAPHFDVPLRLHRPHKVVRFFCPNVSTSSSWEYDLYFTTIDDHEGVTLVDENATASMASLTLGMPDLEAALEKLNITSNSQQAISSLPLLADESRKNVDVRIRLSDPQRLRTLVQVVECGLSDSMESSALALRCIGNACNDDAGGTAARDTMAQFGFAWGVQCLSAGDNDVKTLTTKVLFNVCSGHELAQKGCYDDRVHYQLMYWICDLGSIITKEHSDSNMALDDTINLQNLAIDVLFEICGHRPEQPNETMPFEFFGALFSTMKDLDGRADPDDSLMAILLIFLRDPAIQTSVIDNGLFEDLWLSFCSHEQRTASRATSHDFNDEDDQTQLQNSIALSTNSIWVLSDISASRTFAVRYGFKDSIIQTFISDILHDADELRSSDEHNALDSKERVLHARCQIMGNFLWVQPPQTYGFLVSWSGAHVDFAWPFEGKQPFLPAVLEILIQARSVDLLHSAAGLLTMLARAGGKAREGIGSNSKTPEAMERLCRHDRTELRQSAVKILKALGTESRSNQERFAALAQEVITSLSREAQQAQSSNGGTIPDGAEGRVTDA